MFTVRHALKPALNYMNFSYPIPYYNAKNIKLILQYQCMNEF